MATKLVRTAASAIIYDPVVATSALTPALNLGAVFLRSVTATSATTAVWNIRDGTLVTSTPIRLTIRVAANDTVPVQLVGATFSNGIYAELLSGTGECSLEFDGG